MKKVVFIEGMTCGHCVSHVTEALKSLKSVTSVNVSLEEKRAILESSNELNEADIKNAVDEAGYSVSSITEG